MQPTFNWSLSIWHTWKYIFIWVYIWCIKICCTNSIDTGTGDTFSFPWTCMVDVHVHAQWSSTLRKAYTTLKSLPEFEKVQRLPLSINFASRIKIASLYGYETSMSCTSGATRSIDCTQTDPLGKLRARWERPGTPDCFRGCSRRRLRTMITLQYPQLACVVLTTIYWVWHTGLGIANFTLVTLDFSFYFWRKVFSLQPP